MINWQHVDTVLLDMDGTLLDLHYDNHFWLEHLPKHYAKLHSRDFASAKQELLAKIQSQRGTLNWYCLDYWSDELQLDIVALKAEIKHLITIRPFVDEFLHRLNVGPQHVILVTNAHRDGLDIKLEHTGIDRWFDHIIASHDYQLPKEDPDFWQHLNRQHPFDPERTLLIDDNQTVLGSAQTHGIEHLITLLQPDSKQAARERTDFPGILHFDEILPQLCPIPRSAPASLLNTLQDSQYLATQSLTDE